MQTRIARLEVNRCQGLPILPSVIERNLNIACRRGRSELPPGDADSETGLEASAGV